MICKNGIAALMIFQAAVSLPAAVLTVTSLADAGAGSLRQQVTLSSPGDTILFAVSGTIVLSSAINIPYSLFVQGPGAAQLTVSGDFVDRAFIVAGNPVFISGMTIRDGLVTGANGADGKLFNDGQSGSDATGGAILDTNSPSDNLVLSNCWVVGNTAQGGNGGRGGDDGPAATFGPPGNGGAGGQAVGGALFIQASATFINCTFSLNQAIGGQGGAGGNDISKILTSVSGGLGAAAGDGQGGAVCSGNNGTVSYINCTFSGNAAMGGGGGNGGNASADPGGNGGAAGNGSCGAVSCGTFITTSSAFLSCTIVSNSAFAGSGGSGGTGSPPGSAGVAGEGDVGGVCGAYTTACSDCSIGNTILADNYADTGITNYSIPFTDLGFNFIGSYDAMICDSKSTTQLGSVAAPLHSQLGPLAQNGGGLPTHATRLSVPANPITDQGFSFGLTNDERGAPRPYVFVSISEPPGGDGSDIGAFELGSAGLGLGKGSNHILITWPAFYGDFTLQFTTNFLLPNGWSSVTDSPSLIGNVFAVTNDPAGANRFYRLMSR